MTLGDERVDTEVDDGVAELFDCVGPDFPEADVASTSSSPHFVRLPRSLVHGVGVEFVDEPAAERAEGALTCDAFAECLGRSVAADLEAQQLDAELLAVDVTSTTAGRRVRFTSGDEAGVRPVHLDIVVLRRRRVVSVLWFGDTPEPFASDVRTDVVERVLARAG